MAFDCLGLFCSWVMTLSIHEAQGKRSTVSFDAHMLSQKLETLSQVVLDNTIKHFTQCCMYISDQSTAPHQIPGIGSNMDVNYGRFCDVMLH
jgi:hypothetical protein